MTNIYFGFSGYQDLKDYYGSPDGFPPEDAIKFACLDKNRYSPRLGKTYVIFDMGTELWLDVDKYTEGFQGNWGPNPQSVSPISILYGRIEDETAAEALNRILERQ